MHRVVVRCWRCRVGPAASERLGAVVAASEDDLTPVAGVALWGLLFDRLCASQVVGESDRRRLRPLGAGPYSGGAYYRALVETQLGERPLV